ncbi:MAG: hypothetical protein HYY28_04690 [Betaproteobacteria bacterium]|nr:hypothetical protein [Betaproteobacteria bacterium]
MARILSGLLLLLSLCYAFAAQAVDNPPAESSGSMGTIIFGILFFGFCIGFVWLVWRNEKKQKQDPK